MSGVPVVYKCSRCGFPLYVFARVGQSSYGLPTPSEVIYMHGGRCPRCGKKLEKPDYKRVRIDLNVASNARSLLEQARRMRAPITGAEMHLVNMVRSLGHGEAEAVT